MIKDPEVEAVVITSIDPTHYDYVMKTLAEKKWCFCEKPLALTGKDCETIINRELDAAEQAFVDYIFSDTGRAIVIENGYIPAY